jgi:ABC-type Zn2+ transport system substrate-binding protein/surface adhesin
LIAGGLGNPNPQSRTKISQTLIGLPSRDQHDDKLDDRDKSENRLREAQHSGNDDHPKHPHHKAFLRFALSGSIEGQFTFSFWPARR